MPYYIKTGAIGCDGWAVTKEDGEVIGCHIAKDEAIAQMVAVSLAEDIEPGGERALPDNYRPSLSQDVPAGRACGNCAFYDETMIQESDGGLVAYCQRWNEYVRGDFYCNAWEPKAEVEDDEDDESGYEELLEERQVNLSPPEYMREAAKRGLRLYAEGEAGDGLTPKTVREARDMASGDVSEDKWRRIAPWIARHLDDLDVVEDNEITPGLVAHLLWGSGPTKADAQRALEYAENIVTQLENETTRLWSVQDRSEEIRKALPEVEKREFAQEFEVRELSNGGVQFSGYAAVFNSDSEPLPFIERILPSAFDKTLKSRNNIKMYLNHDSTLVLGSTRAKTLRLSTDTKGLYTEADLPDTSYARDLAEVMRRGDVDSMSFGFSVPRNGDSWSQDGMQRSLKEVRLHEVSVVTGFPAYSATSASVRSIDALAEAVGADADQLAEALTLLENGKELSADHASLLSEAVTKLRANTSNSNTVKLKSLHLELLKNKF